MAGISWFEVGQVETCFTYSLSGHGSMCHSGSVGHWRIGHFSQPHQRGAEHASEWVDGEMCVDGVKCYWE